MFLPRMIQRSVVKAGLCSHGKTDKSVGYHAVARYALQKRRNKNLAEKTVAYYVGYTRTQEPREYGHRYVLVCKPAQIAHSSTHRRDPKLAAEEKFEKEIEAYLLMEQELLRNPKYMNKYVAIHNGQVVDFDSDRVALADRAYAKYGYVPILIKKVETERYTRFYSSRRPR